MKTIVRGFMSIAAIATSIVIGIVSVAQVMGAERGELELEQEIFEFELDELVVDVDRPKLTPTASRLKKLRDSGQWDHEAKLTLARALWGEAGVSPRNRWEGERVKYCELIEENDDCFPNLDWKLIPWVLLKRWEDIHENTSREVKFASLIKAYCSPLKVRLASRKRELEMKALGNFHEIMLIQRRRFLQSLTWQGDKLRAREELYFTGWTAIKEVVTRWGAGEIENSCERARHWDRRGAKTKPGLKLLDCGKTLNAFYGS